MMIEVRKDVIAATGGAQIPWENSSLTRQFYFAPGRRAERIARDAALAARRRPARRQSPAFLSRPLSRRLACRRREGAAGGSLASRQRREPTRAGRRRKMSRNCCGDWREAGASARSSNSIWRAIPPARMSRRRTICSPACSRRKGSDAPPGVVCERLATHPRDATANTPGVDLDTLARNAEAGDRRLPRGGRRSIPMSPHYLALLARATAAAGQRDEAIGALSKSGGRGRRARDGQPRPAAGIGRRRRPRISSPPTRSTKKRRRAAAPTARSTSRSP